MREPAVASLGSLERRSVCLTERNRAVASRPRRAEGVGGPWATEKQRRDAPQIRDFATEGKPIGALASLIAAVIAMAVGCSSPGTGSSASNGEAAAQSPQATAEAPPLVVLSPPGQKPAAVSVEVVRTPRQIQRGLMFREHMPPDHGMLFLMPEERVHSFWMHNTLIPLDMIFIGKDMTVAGVVANATPLTDDSRRVDRPSLYVLEVNGGWAAAHHVGPGTPVRFQNVRQ